MSTHPTVDSDEAICFVVVAGRPLDKAIQAVHCASAVVDDLDHAAIHPRRRCIAKLAPPLTPPLPSSLPTIASPPAEKPPSREDAARDTHRPSACTIYCLLESVLSTSSTSASP
ncbi:hypothetical protein ACLOJK_006786 [Asimina triloba]